MVFRRQPRMPHRNTPCTFLCNCILQAAIDFAEVRMRKRSCGANGWAGEYTDGRILSSPIFFFGGFFGKCLLQGAIDFAEVAYPRKAWQALHLTLTNCGTASLIFKMLIKHILKALFHVSHKLNVLNCKKKL